MNQQIKSLAVQSGLKVESLMTNPPKPFQIIGTVEDFEKFAQLIVAEVLAVQEKLIADGHNAWHLHRPTQNHFGVE